MKEFIEMPFGAKDSELCGWEYTIPVGFVASIEKDKIIVKKEEGEDEKIRKEILEYFRQFKNEELRGVDISDWIAWLEKQAEYANFRNKIQIGDRVTRNRDGVLVNLSQLNRVAKKDEKQGNNADKIPLLYRTEVDCLCHRHTP